MAGINVITFQPVQPQPSNLPANLFGIIPRTNQIFTPAQRPALDLFGDKFPCLDGVGTVDFGKGYKQSRDLPITMQVMDVVAIFGQAPHLRPTVKGPDMIFMPQMSMGIEYPVGKKIPQFPIIKFTIQLAHMRKLADWRNSFSQGMLSDTL
jgi:hypothetical protein